MVDFIGFKQSTWGGYETGKSFPSLKDFLKICETFGVSETELLHKDLSKGGSLIEKTSDKKIKTKGSLKGSLSGSLIEKNEPFSITNEPLGYPNSGLIPNVYDFDTPAAAGSAMLLMSQDKYRVKPNLYLPGLGPGIHIRNPIKGDSMHSTIKNGDKVVSTLLTCVSDIRQGFIHTILERTDLGDGLLCKRIYLEGEYVEYVSDNDIYKPEKRHLNDIIALFRVREIHSADLRPYYNDLRKEIREIRSEMADIRRLLKYK